MSFLRSAVRPIWLYGRSIGFCIIALLAAQSGRAAPVIPSASSDFVTVTVKFLPNVALSNPVTVTLRPDSCPPCRQLHDTHYARENTRETIVALSLPRDRSLSLAFDVARPVLTRAVLETSDLPLEQHNDTVVVALPPLTRDATASGEFATHVTGEGYVLRFEHADPVRRFGVYADVLPVDARHAADNFEFAQREAVEELGLGREAVAQQLGIIEIMGFDTNEPHGHVDAPPHIHMHLRWPYNVGTQIGHFYLKPDGRLDHIRVGVAGLNMPTKDFSPGETFATISPKGQIFYVQSITPEGNLVLKTADGRRCAIGLPEDDRRQGLHVHCDGHAVVFVRVEDDLARGVLKVHTNDMTETYRYDTGTGNLLTPSNQPAPPLSAIVQHYTGLVPEGL